jgi:oligosaccharide repeat unit polymerase
MPAVTLPRQEARDPARSAEVAATDGERSERNDAAAERRWRLAWWIHPTSALLLINFPVLLLALSEGPAGLAYFKNYEDNYTPYNCFVAVASLLALTCGTLIFGLFGAPSTHAFSIDPLRAKLVLRWLGVVALAAYVLLLGPWLLNPEIVWQALQGLGADEARRSMDRMPGITSFTNIAPVFCAVWAAARLDPRFRANTELKCLFAGLVLLTLARAIVGSERLALIEFVVPLVLAQAAFRWRPSPFRASFPLLGLIAFVAIFAAAEYLRSWQYYQFRVGDQFWEFSILRLVGYYSTALNNGMGMFQLHSPLGLPNFTASGLAKLPFWPFARTDAGNITEDIWAVYLFEFANAEFNNISGLFAPLIDFGVVIGLTVMCILGISVGLLYRSYAQRRIAGLILYPTCYVGILEIIRLFYFGESRVVPVFLVAGLVGWALSGRSGGRPRRQVWAGFERRAPGGITEEPGPRKKKLRDFTQLRSITHREQ